MTRAEELLQELEVEAKTTVRVLERIPDGRLDWRPHLRVPSIYGPSADEHAFGA